METDFIMFVVQEPVYPLLSRYLLEMKAELGFVSEPPDLEVRQSKNELGIVIGIHYNRR